jgi:hypothetical protein
MECSGSSLRVLVAEDNEDTATSLSILLRLYGYEVERAPTDQVRCERASEAARRNLARRCSPEDEWLACGEANPRACVWKTALSTATKIPSRFSTWKFPGSRTRPEPDPEPEE